jgi:SAM-dependent methyltransferase
MKDYHYEKFAEEYDIIEANDNIKKLNQVLDKILKRHGVKSILDMTCGTGEQSIYLHKKGYCVVASDKSRDMLAVAKKKYSFLSWSKGDIRNSVYGKFDAVISIYNAIAHLSKNDFEKALKNIAKNLKEGGIYIFDIFNAEFMRKKFINHEFIDQCIELKNKKFVRFNKNTFDRKRNIMHINQKTYIQEGMQNPRIFMEKWDMQIYASDELRKMLQRNNFGKISFLDICGKKFDRKKSLSLLCIAYKVQ